MINMSKSLEKQIEELINEIYNKLDNPDNKLEEHDRLVEDFFNYCLGKKENEKKLEAMFAVSLLLPKITSGPYRRAATNLMKKLTYQKLPSGLSLYEGKFTSTREHLLGYSYHYYKFPDSHKFEIPKQLSRLEKFVFHFLFYMFINCVLIAVVTNRFEEIEKHTAILCYVPLPGLCTKFSEDGVLNALFPCKQSAFVQLTILELFSSPPLQAIVKFKWHAYGRYYFFIWFIGYLTTVILFLMMIYINNKIFNKIILIVNMIWGVILILFFCRCGLTLLLMNVKIKRYSLSFLTHLAIIGIFLPFVISFLEFYDYFGLEPLESSLGIKVWI
jgi:hypothetical protein